MYLELSELLHQLLLLFAVAEWRKDVQEHFEEIQILPRNAGQCEDGSDAAHTHRHTHSIVFSLCPEVVGNV